MLTAESAESVTVAALDAERDIHLQAGAPLPPGAEIAVFNDPPILKLLGLLEGQDLTHLLEYCQVAAEAGLGTATLFRRFATKNDLVAELVQSLLTYFVDVAAEAAE